MSESRIMDNLENIEEIDNVALKGKLKFPIFRTFLN